jgi:predicted DNA-binding ribbon-helix-helix protein
VSGPVKRSVTIAGHETSISLEPIFWDALRAAALERGLPINALIAELDVERISSPEPANLASALRVWLFERATSKLRVDREAGVERGAG